MIVVVMGCGRVGAMVSTSLAEQGDTVHVLDIDPEKFRRLPAELVEKGQIIRVLGDGVQERNLRRARIERATVFVAVSNKDTRNAFASQIAKHIFEVPRVVCRLTDPERQEMYTQLGLTVVSPTEIVSEMLLEAVRERG